MNQNTGTIMQDRIRQLFLAPVYAADPEKEQDARTTHRVGVTLLVLAAFSIPFIFLLETPVREYALGATIVGFFIWLFTIQLVKQEKIIAAKTIILAVNTGNLFGIVYAIGGLERATVFTTLFLLALANLLFPRRGAIVYGFILLAITTVILVLDSLNLVPEPVIDNSVRSIYFLYTFTIIAVASMLAIASANSQRNLDIVRRNEAELRERNRELDELRTFLKERVAERTSQLGKRASQLEAISSVARSAASLQNLEELLPVVTRLVSDRFGYYHTGIFLLDENHEYAFLRATNSEGGRRMLNRQHKLKLDAQSIVGYVTSRGEPRIALDVGTDAVFFDNPDLPNTRSEMALPLRVGERVIGALDVQSTQPNAFTEDDISTLTTLTDQIAIAIENARLFSEARTALKESEETFGRYIRQEWSNFAQQAKSAGYLFDGKRTIPVDERDKQEKSKALPQTGRLTLEKDTRELVVPIRLRGQTIGFLDVKSKSGNRKWTQDDITLLEAAAERAALALENARLVDSAQRRASRERTIGEISSKIGAVSNMDAIMQAAVEELGRRIGGATEVTLELDTEHTPSND
jgi:GAF domain-containing protein